MNGMAVSEVFCCVVLVFCLIWIIGGTATVIATIWKYGLPPGQTKEKVRLLLACWIYFPIVLVTMRHFATTNDDS